MVDFTDKIKSAKMYATDFGSQSNIGHYPEGSVNEEASDWVEVARQWAENPVDVPVMDVAEDFSSLHYSQKSQDVYDGVVAEGDAQVARILAEGDTQDLRVTTEGDTQDLRVTTEGNTQVARVIAQGDTEVAELIAEGDVQEARATAEADRAEAEADASAVSAAAALASESAAAVSAAEALVSEGLADDHADRAEVVANTLDNALRNGGYFAVSAGSYPTPTDQTLPFTWFCTDTGDTGDGIIWTTGDMLEYVPHVSDPIGTFGNYFRVAGELAGGVPPEPQPITILDDLIMVQDKKIIFETAAGTDQRDVIHLDQNGDIVVGQHNVNGAIDGIGFAALHVDLISNIDPVTGIAGNVNPGLIGPAVLGSIPATGVDITSPQTISGAKTYTAIVKCSTAPVAVEDLTRKDYADAQDAANLVTANSYTDSANAAQDLIIDGKAPAVHTHGFADVAAGTSVGTFVADNFQATSDLRLKSNIEIIPDALAKINTLTGNTYLKNGNKDAGVIAQEVQKVLPEAVGIGEDAAKTLSVDYNSLTALLIEAVKELTAQNAELTKRLDKLGG